MVKFIYLVVFIVITSACNNKDKPQATISEEPVSDTTIVLDTLSYDEKERDLDSLVHKDFKNYSLSGICIYESRYYREYYYKDLFGVRDSVVALFINEYKVCHIIETQVSSIDIGEDGCTGCQLMFPVLEAGNDDCRFIIKGLSNFNKEAEIYSDTIQLPLPPQKLDIVLSGVTYTFLSEGVDSDGNIINRINRVRDWGSVKKYKLYLESEGAKQLLMDLNGFADTSPQLVWCNDIDGDSKPDFIISASPLYETYRILLFLSSFAENNELVKLVAITVDHFDC